MRKTSNRGGTYLLPCQKTLQAACGNRKGGDSVSVSTLVNSLSHAVARLFQYTWHSVALLLPGGEWQINLLSIRVDIFSVITTWTVSAGKNRAVCVDTFPLAQIRHREDPCYVCHLCSTRFSVLLGMYPRISYIAACRNLTLAKLAGFQFPDAL